MLGSAIIRFGNKVQKQGDSYYGVTRSQVDLRDFGKVQALFTDFRPDVVLHCAAKVGGIQANIDNPVSFLSDNILMDEAVMLAARDTGVKKLVYFGSSCMYPKDYRQPLVEDDILAAPLEPTNQGYALAKIVGSELATCISTETGFAYKTLIMSNLYGPGDNFDLENSHVLPALLRKFHEARVQGHETVTLWGDGTPLREFLHSDDLALACLTMLEKYDGDVALNVGTGKDVSIRDLAEMIADIVGFTGNIVWDASKPNGTRRKVLDVSKVQGLGWSHQVGLRAGIQNTYDWYSKTLS